MIKYLLPALLLTACADATDLPENSTETPDSHALVVSPDHITVTTASGDTVLPLLQAYAYVNDFGNIYTDVQEDSLNALLKHYHDTSTNQIAVLTLPDYGIDYERETYTLAHANGWGIGDSIQNNGVLISIDKKARFIRIDNGLGVETVVSDSLTASFIVDVMSPAFYQEDYVGGIVDVVQAYAEALKFF